MLSEKLITTLEIFHVVKSFGDRKKMLMRVSVDIKRITNEVHAIKLPDEPPLQELKEELKKANHYMYGDLKRCESYFPEATDAFEIIESGEFYEKLTHVQKMLINFSRAEKDSRDPLRQSKQLAEKLSERLKQKAQETERQAESMRARTAAGTAGLLAGGAGLVALGFLTGGAAWIAAGALAGTTCSAGAAAVTAGSELNSMRDLAKGFKNHSNQLVAIAIDLETICCKVETIINISEDVEKLRTALHFFKQEEMARKQQEEIAAKQEEMARKRQEKIAAKQKKTAAKEMTAEMLSCYTVDTMTPPREQKIELIRRVIKDTKMRANELEAFNLSNETLMKELKTELGKLQESGSFLDAQLKTFRKEIKTFERTIKEEIKGGCVLQRELKVFYRLSSDLSEAFKSFLRHSSKSQYLATELMDKMEQKAGKMEKEAYEKGNWSVAKIVGTAAEEVALGTRRFLRGGATRNVSEARSGAVCSAEASVTASNTSVDMQAMQELAKGMKDNSDKLGFIIAISSCNGAGAINLDEAAIEVLQTALEFFSENLLKDDRIGLHHDIEVKDAMVEAKMDAEDAEIARLNDQIKMHNFY